MAFSRAQRRSLATGFGLILAAATLVALIWLGSYLPGFAGEVFSIIAGLMWTPIILDLTIFLFGIILILWLNWFLRAREGDEFVYLEQVEGPGAAGLPEQARTAIFTEEPEPQGLSPALAAIEGALELGDFPEAAQLLYELPEDELRTPEVLALRIQLARKKGDPSKGEELLEELRLISPRHPLCSPDPDPNLS